MKQWVKKLLDQLDMDWKKNTAEQAEQHLDSNEDRATLLYLLDVYNKHLIEIDRHPVRKVREKLDAFAKNLVHPDQSVEKVLFELRQFFSSYRIDEYTYLQNTFDDFKRIIWDFADQLSEDIEYEQLKDAEASRSLEQLREAVDLNSIDALRSKSREFIDFYIKYQSQKNQRRSQRMNSVRKNLTTVKKQLLEANQSMREDHLTGAFNRRSFDEQMKNHHKLFEISKTPVSLIILDIDHFKKVNDTYGHDIGDFVLKECVRMLKEVFAREQDFLARIGGEEFAIITPDYEPDALVAKAEQALEKIRKEVFVHGQHQIRFTISLGLAPLLPGESVDQWIKRADTALYNSKNTGRNKYTMAPNGKIQSVA